MDYDSSFLEPEAGQRALWLLYKYGGWGYLEDLGMDRAAAEPAFQAFDAGNVVGKRLTKTQCRMLEEQVPGFKDARVELQLAYILRYYSEEQDKKVRTNGNRAILSRRGRHGTTRRLRPAG